MTSSKLPDEELVAISKMKNGRSEAAYGFLVSRHEKWVLRMLKKLLRSAEAEEVKQDSFFNGWKQIRNLRENTHFRGWIRSIAVKSAYKKHRRARLELKVQKEREQTNASSVKLGKRLETRDAVRRVMLGLNYVHREVLVLRYIEELSIKEISEMLQLSESATKMRLSRARDRFKAKYKRATRGRS